MIFSLVFVARKPLRYYIVRHAVSLIEVKSPFILFTVFLNMFISIFIVISQILIFIWVMLFLNNYKCLFHFFMVYQIIFSMF